MGCVPEPVEPPWVGVPEEPGELEDLPAAVFLLADGVRWAAAFREVLAFGVGLKLAIAADPTCVSEPGPVAVLGLAVCGIMFWAVDCVPQADKRPTPAMRSPAGTMVA